MTFENPYGPLDRLLHRIAFRGRRTQQAIGEMEAVIFRDELRTTSLENPVFITSLPRSGTTILLNLLCGTDSFASHTYRDMPFVLCPITWRRFSRHFASKATTRERDHGDGLRVSEDSPEAFEEMVWKHFWPDHYRHDRIRTWDAGERNREFEAFFETHMRKVIALRRSAPQESLRYVSKNNLNIARIAFPPSPLRRGTFLIPFREPIQQAASMLRQHERFLAIHDRHEFIREYMEAIGHHEFGRGLRPVDFAGWLDQAASADDLEFWLRYWIAAYRHVSEHARPNVRLVSYSRLTEDPERTLARIAGSIGIREVELTRQAGRLRPPRSHDVDLEGVCKHVLQRAQQLYRELEERTAG